MADDPADESTASPEPAEPGDLAARLADVHRRTEELAARVANFSVEAEQLAADTAPPADQPPRPRPSPRPRAEPESRPEEEPEGKPEGKPADEQAKVDTSDLEKQIDEALAAEPKQPDESAAKSDGKSEGEPADKPARKGLGRWGRRARKLAITLVVVVAAVWAMRTWVVQPFYVPSGSMEPTLHGCASCNDDHILVQKISYDFHDPQRGDIVVFDKPSSWKDVKDPVLIKRVIGLPGDHLVIKHRAVYVNGQLLNEPYVNKSCHGTEPGSKGARLRVPKGDIVVMGDNRCNSDDSRDEGPVPISDVVGKAFLIIWPFSRFGAP